MQRSTQISLGLVFLITAWMLSGTMAGTRLPSVVAPEPAEVEPVRVLVATPALREVTREVVVQGQLEPRRQVEVRAETAGRVVGLPAAKGQRVGAGALLVELEVGEREAQLARARAEVASRRMELDAIRKLEAQGMQAQTRLKQAEAAFAAAEAERARIGLDLERTRVRAPFAGVLESRSVEIGALAERGDTLVQIVDDAVLKAVGQVPQQSAGSLSVGQPVGVRLLDGRERSGRLTYLARVADPGTRSFRVEAELDNEDRVLTSGLSAELRIAVASEPAHFVSPAVLTLDDAGRVGVKAVAADQRVEFHPTAVVRADPGGVWVTGLPAKVRVITQGQGFVAPGERVTAVPAG